jgi:hypothetical protein
MSLKSGRDVLLAKDGAVADQVNVFNSNGTPTSYATNLRLWLSRFIFYARRKIVEIHGEQSETKRHRMPRSNTAWKLPR